MAAQASVSFFEMATLHRGISLAYDMALYVRFKIAPTLNV
jgi:hypothetical protein